MSSCTKIKGRNRQICIGDMQHRIKLQSRSLSQPFFEDVDFDENFQDQSEVWAMINTVSGKTLFDGVNQDINITHEVYIMYDLSVTAETWIEYDGRRFDILKVENLDERKQFMRLICSERGANTYEASKA